MQMLETMNPELDCQIDLPMEFDRSTARSLTAKQPQAGLRSHDRPLREESVDEESNASGLPVESFEKMGLSKIMLRALKRAGYQTPSPIQQRVIPAALEGHDIIGQARTGTGKTAAFAIPILEMLDPITECRNPQALIIVPTRELAEQVYQEIERLAYGCPTYCVVLAGGKHMRRQIDKLKKGVQIVVGTPGRIQDHISRRTFRTEDLWCVVLDEADRMLDIGFRPAIEKILRSCPRDRQTLLLSATLPPSIQRLTQRYLRDPVHINCSQKQVSVDTIEQRYFTVRQEQKYATLVSLLRRERPTQAIVFCRTKRGTDRLFLKLQKDLPQVEELKSMRVACIHGDMNQRDRDRVFSALRAGELDLLVATDVVGRGIDVSTVSHIINYDIPLDCDDYVHRVGRTGRMGREGIAFTFVTPDEGDQLTAIEQNINRLLERDSLPELEEAAAARPASAPTGEPTREGASAEALTAAAADSLTRPPKKRRLFPMKRKLKRRL
ncbi:MAG: DEAD/DEAH box helicase [Pirellulaceae bacterium]|nr:MAG: DEAD/DEAH box helicase [Pirellulaceae bacterium]